LAKTLNANRKNPGLKARAWEWPRLGPIEAVFIN